MKYEIDQKVINRIKKRINEKFDSAISQINSNIIERCIENDIIVDEMRYNMMLSKLVGEIGGEKKMENHIMITKEMREDAAKCPDRLDCGGCTMRKVVESARPAKCAAFLAGLPYVWENAPKWATCATIAFTGNGEAFISTYYREPEETFEEKLIERYAEIFRENNVGISHVLGAMLEDFKKEKGVE